jgi:hypothetical protein
VKRAAKPPTDPELKRRIQELIDFQSGGYNDENFAAAGERGQAGGWSSQRDY